eukprot:1003803-Alexandrium_andersonii.AAC.1
MRARGYCGDAAVRSPQPLRRIVVDRSSCCGGVSTAAPAAVSAAAGAVAQLSSDRGSAADAR